MEQELIKKLVVSYKSMEELLKREEAMNKTLHNFLQREKMYEFYDSRIEIDNNNYRLVLEIKLKDEYNERTDY